MGGLVMFLVTGATGMLRMLDQPETIKQVVGVAN
jgi:hypothetical protein